MLIQRTPRDSTWTPLTFPLPMWWVPSFVETITLCSGANHFNIASIITSIITSTSAGHPSSSSSQGPALSLVRPDCALTRSGSQLPRYKIERQISQIHIFSAGCSESQCRARAGPSGDTNNGHMMLTKLLRNTLENFLRSPCHFLELGLYTARNDSFSNTTPGERRSIGSKGTARGSLWAPCSDQQPGSCCQNGTKLQGN